MATGLPEGFGPLEPSILVRRLRLLAEKRKGAGIVDELELQHLVSVILHGALVLRDLYTSDRIGPLLSGDARAAARGLVGPALEADAPELELVARVGRLPEDVRLLGDKCLFDIGISRIREYHGFDLQDLGVRAYRMASEILALLGEDDRLRGFFDRNRLGPLPIGEEITFLKQCAERFGVHADLLRHLDLGEPLQSDTTPGILVPRPRLDGVAGSATLAPMPPATAADTRPGGGAPAGPDLSGDHAGPDGAADEHAGRLTASVESSAAAGIRPGSDLRPAIAEAATPSEFEELGLSREDLLSSYERIVLFASLDVERLGERLNRVVVDQPEAVEALLDEFALFAAGTQNLTKPPSYFFVGPTGVGKNHLVESLVRLLEEEAGVEIPLLTIDGPNYTDASDINELRGSTRGFIRSDEEGLLAEFHERSSRAPVSVILVDEVEKAHPHLRKFFLSLMDRGTVTDNRGRALSFANSMLFFTSNLGYSEAVARGAPIGYQGECSRTEFERSDVTRALKQALSAEFVNRLRIVRFLHLSRASIDRILDLELERLRRRFREVHGIEVVLAPAAREEVIARGYSYDYGARHLSAVLNRVANVEVSRRLKRDDRGGSRTGGETLEYLRQVRRKERAFDPREVRARVLGEARVRVPYRTLTIDFESGEFVYRT